MKKYLLSIVLMLAFGGSVMAQLGAPKITQKDTLVIVSCYYNGTELNMEDWPAAILIDDAVNLQIADYVYKKGKPVYQDLYSYNSSWDGHIDYYRYSATCNGKKSDVSIIKPREDCHSDYYGKYVIDDYQFYVVTLKMAKKLFDGGDR